MNATEGSWEAWSDEKENWNVGVADRGTTGLIAMFGWGEQAEADARAVVAGREALDALEAAEGRAEKYKAEAHLLTDERDTAEAENTRLREALEACVDELNRWGWSEIREQEVRRRVADARAALVSRSERDASNG